MYLNGMKMSTKTTQICLQSIYFTLLTVAGAFFTSCVKDTAVPEVDFEVHVERPIVTAGEPVLFEFSGSANLITFYSGEPGSEYAYRDRVSVQGEPLMEFMSDQQNAIEDNSLRLMLSKDFNGVYNQESLEKATWIDISSQVTFSTGSANTPSGIIDLSSYVDADNDLVFIGFKYTAEHSDVAQPIWTITDLVLYNKLADGTTVSVASLVDLSWGAINVAGSQSWTSNANQLRFVGGASGADANEDWLITKPLQLHRVKRAYGISVKGNPIAKQVGYEYTFETPGTYKAAFEALNVNRWDKKSKVIEMTITVQ